MISSTNDLQLVFAEGNDLLYPITLRRLNQKAPVDLSTAAAILLEWEDDQGVEQVAVNVSSTLPGADWANGLVMLPINPSNFTAVVGRYTFSLTVQIAGQTITHVTGVIEVRERPGFPSA